MYIQIFVVGIATAFLFLFLGKDSFFPKFTGYLIMALFGVLSVASPLEIKTGLIDTAGVIIDTYTPLTGVSYRFFSLILTVIGLVGAYFISFDEYTTRKKRSEMEVESDV